VGYDNINPPPTIKPKVDPPNKNKDQQQQQNQQQQQIDETKQHQQTLPSVGAVLLLSIFTIAALKFKPNDTTAYGYTIWFGLLPSVCNFIDCVYPNRFLFF
jgi:hypothetical protein